MEIKITPTKTVLLLDGIPLRLWEGVTDKGIRCSVFIHRVAVAPGADPGDFERLLKLVPPPEDLSVILKPEPSNN